jgi:hypothetical protein
VSLTPGVEPTHPLIQLALEVKRPGLEADQSLPSSVEVKNKGSYNSTPTYAYTAFTGTISLLQTEFLFYDNYLANTSMYEKERCLEGTVRLVQS